MLRENSGQSQQKADADLGDLDPVLVQISEVFASTTDHEQAYERFAQQVRKLVDFDCIAINVIHHDSGTFTTKYVSAPLMPGRQRGQTLPLEGTGTHLVLQTGQTLVRQEISAVGQFLVDPLLRTAGIQSSIRVPLFTNGRVIGTLGLRSRRVAAYGPREQAILERLANQIAPAVENAQLYQEVQATREEIAVVDEVAQIVNSAPDIDRVYVKFAQEMTKLVDFDRVNINIIDRDANAYVIKFLVGVVQPGRRAGDTVPLEGTQTQELMMTGQTSILDDLIVDSRFRADPVLLALGLRSRIAVPLSSKGQVIGSLVLHSRREAAYRIREQIILERLADQIVPAVENAQLYQRFQATREELDVVDRLPRRVGSGRPPGA